MSKIIKSLVIMVAIGAIAAGATWSYFSDEEKSVGNTFTAGSLDLKVDSQSHYNGMVCEGGIWKEEDNCTTSGNNLVSEGGFENPEITNPDHWQIFDGSPWTVVGTPDPGDTSGLEYHEDGIYLGSTAAEGDQYVELDGYYPVKISQDIPASATGKYLVSFKYAPRPGHNENKLQVKFDGAEILNTTLASANPFAWTTFSQVITGPTNGTVNISFEETGANDQLGMFLDAVDVRSATCEPLPTPELIGEDCDGTWELTDLNSTHKFFNFTDIKPGDEGEDTVSLHVYDNDAWVRLVIDNITNTEESCTEPEEEAENGDCGTVGELGSKLLFTVFSDANCDNKQNGNDQTLISAGTIDPNGEEWVLPQPLVGNTTACFGIAWDLPLETGNEVQTDIFSADISFEVEQWRNNPTPFDGI